MVLLSSFKGKQFENYFLLNTALLLVMGQSSQIVNFLISVNLDFLIYLVRYFAYDNYLCKLLRFNAKGSTQAIDK